jgi:hypothetical protein
VISPLRRVIALLVATSGHPVPHRLLQRLQELNRVLGIESETARAARRHRWIT